MIDLDPGCTETLAVIRYELKNGQLAQFLENQPNKPLTDETRILFLRTLREQIPKNFSTKIWAEEPNDPDNRRELQSSALRGLVKTGFINAQRGLDDVTSRESDVLAKLWKDFSQQPHLYADKQIAEALKGAVQDIQAQIDTNFGGKLKSLIPELKTFGYTTSPAYVTFSINAIKQPQILCFYNLTGMFITCRLHHSFLL